MLFTDFLKTAIYLVLATASCLVTLAVIGTTRLGDDFTLFLGGGWCLAMGLLGVWMGRKGELPGRLRDLLAQATTATSLPDTTPGRVIANRLWPLAVLVLVCAALAWVSPLVAAIAAGYGLLCALAWRRHPAAVKAIEERDGVRFFVEPTGPLESIKLVRTPGWRRLTPVNGRQPST